MLLDMVALLLKDEAMTSYEILTTADTLLCDKFAERRGVASLSLMQRAGEGIVAAITKRWSKRPVIIACGPGNNGGDGFVCARLLSEAGWPVQLGLFGEQGQLSGDAATMAQRWTGPVDDFHALKPQPGALLIDALFGAGLTRALDKELAAKLGDLAATASASVAVDLPSGLSGDAAGGLSAPYSVDLTVSFHAYKPAHVLHPAAGQCGEVVLVDIGIPEDWQDEVKPLARLNSAAHWQTDLPQPDTGDHKHARGRLMVFSGPASATGAARLAANAGLNAGAGLVTLASPPDAVPVNAAHLSAIMLREWSAPYEAEQLIDQMQADACVIGPAAGIGAETRQAVDTVLTSRAACVLDADGLTSFEKHREQLFDSLRPGDVLTPHIGEFNRLFPNLLTQSAHKIEAVQKAADMAGCTLLLKGPDTVIAAPGETPCVNTHAAPWLATAGSGDVLAGLVAGLMAQGIRGFDAACMGAWLHGDAARRTGRGLRAESLCAAIGAALTTRLAEVERLRVLERLTQTET